MIQLTRSKENKWILQKNISSDELFKAFVDGLQSQGNQINSNTLRDRLLSNKTYRGRGSGAVNTMDVRLSQACFYMFGYKKDNKFIPSPMTDLYIRKSAPKGKVFLTNLFSMQFPSPYSNTPDNFQVFIGRLIVKLLLEPKLNYRLYIDECIYFLPFIETIDEDGYNELVSSILEWRNLSYEQKESLFKAVKNYDDVFANATHEMNYYFIRIFKRFGVFNVKPEALHNGGKLFSFHHGTGVTMRTDAYESGCKHSGYIELCEDIVEDASKLISRFSPFDHPLLQKACLSKEEWIRELYEFEPLKYLSLILSKTETGEQSRARGDYIDIINQMIYLSKYGSRDGKQFEASLKPLFEMFRENRSVEIISGAGDTDLLCVMDDLKKQDNGVDNMYKINVDAKTSHASTQQINPMRIMRHIQKNGSKYCIIVSPRFASGVRYDIQGFKIVTVRAEVLGNYCLKECSNSEDCQSDFTAINGIIEANLGTDISDLLDELIEKKFSYGSGR